METLENGFSLLGLDLSSVVARQFKTYHRELVEWNSRINLTAITDCREVQVKHFLDSLSVAAALSETVKRSGRLVDVGSGAGFPGLPLKLVYHGMHVTTVESSAKKSAFISHVVGSPRRGERGDMRPEGRAAGPSTGLQGDLRRRRHPGSGFPPGCVRAVTSLLPVGRHCHCHEEGRHPAGKWRKLPTPLTCWEAVSGKSWQWTRPDWRTVEPWWSSTR